MDEFRDNFNEETETDEKTENVDKAENEEDYTWFAASDEAISGTVSEERALSVYKPRVKRKLMKNPVFAAIVSSVITTAICLGIFGRSCCI